MFLPCCQMKYQPLLDFQEENDWIVDLLYIYITYISCREDEADSSGLVSLSLLWSHRVYILVWILGSTNRGFLKSAPLQSSLSTAAKKSQQKVMISSQTRHKHSGTWAHCEPNVIEQTLAAHCWDWIRITSCCLRVAAVYATLCSLFPLAVWYIYFVRMETAAVLHSSQGTRRLSSLCMRTPQSYTVTVHLFLIYCSYMMSSSVLFSLKLHRLFL